MSLWTKFRDTIVGGAKGFIASGGNPFGAVVGAAGGALGRKRPGTIAATVPMTVPILPGAGQFTVHPGVQIAGALGPVLQAGKAVARNPRVRTAVAAAAGAVIGEFIDGDGQVVRVRKKRRRMNPGNPKALNRAVRRLSMYHKQNKKVEAQLRKLAPRPRARRAPAHHHHPAQ